jgi:hypothetical protein
MAIIDRIREIFKPKAVELTTVTERPPEPQPVSSLVGRFVSETERAAIVKKCREMYERDPRARKMIRKLARDMVKGGFILICEDEQAQEIAEGLRKRLKLDQRLDDWVRLSIRDGDSFLEPEINAQMEIVDVTRKPTLQMHRNSNDYDQFEDPEKAFWYADEMNLVSPDNAEAWFAQWQIIHARWEHDEGSRYGSPMMASGTGHWKKVTEGEMDVAIRRKTRAGMKYNHKFPAGTPEGTILAYREINKTALDNPFAAAADYFGTVDISAIEGDANLAQIDDVKHQIATWLQSGEVPMELLGYGEDINRDVLGEKRAEYNETLPQLREWVTAEILQPLLELQWLLQGIYPDSLDYSIEWHAKKEPSAADVRDITDAALRMRALGFPQEVIAAVVARYLPDVDPDDLLPDEGETPVDTERIDQVLTGLRREVNQVATDAAGSVV